MKKLRKFLLKQFKTASQLPIGFGLGLGAHRCVWWGMPSILMFVILYSCWYNQEWIFIQLPPAYKTEWWMKIPMFGEMLLFLFGGITIIYLYFVFIHFRIFPMTEEEWRKLVDEGLIKL